MLEAPLVPLVGLHGGDSQVKDTTLGFDQQSGLSSPKCLGLVVRSSLDIYV